MPSSYSNDNDLDPEEASQQRPRRARPRKQVSAVGASEYVRMDTPGASTASEDDSDLLGVESGTNGRSNLELVAGDDDIGGFRDTEAERPDGGGGKRGMRLRRSNSRSLEIMTRVVQAMESIRVRRRCRCFQRRLPSASKPFSSSFDEGFSSSSNQLAEREEMVPLISGLDRVLGGTVPASSSVRICNSRPPQYLFYMVSGFVCDIIQLAIDYTLHRFGGIDDPSICWAVGFALSIVARHTSHRYLVFGNYVGGYWRSLARMYGGYSIIIVLSTLFNMAMTKAASLPHYVAWVVTLLWTGVVNYFILKKLWTFGGTKTEASNFVLTPES